MCWSPRAARAVPGASCLFSPPMMATLPLAALGASLGLWAYGTYEPNSPLFGRVIGRGPGAGRVAYLTFDDGPNPGATEPIHEEAGRHAQAGQRVEDRLRGTRVRSVVEGEIGHPSRTGAATDHAPEERAIGLVSAVGPEAEGGTKGGERQGRHHGG